MNFSSNSGPLQCCGIRMLSNIFPDDEEAPTRRDGSVVETYADIDARKVFLKKCQKSITSSGTGHSKAIIAVLTDSEIENDLGLAKEMKEQGWKLVHRFKNPSGSTCNILVWTAKKSLPLRGARSPWDQL